MLNDDRMLLKASHTASSGDQGTVKKANYARFFWPALPGISLIVALWAFIAFLRVFLYGGKWEIAVPVFVVASFALIAITAKRETLPAIEGVRTVKASWQRLPWPIVAYSVITGMGYTWVCAFLWFSRRYAVFSGPVVGAMSFILAFYAVVGVLVAWLTGGNWRTAFLIFGIALFVPSIIVLRLHLLK